jgi:hypothetical protein
MHGAHCCSVGPDRGILKGALRHQLQVGRMHTASWVLPTVFNTHASCLTVFLAQARMQLSNNSDVLPKAPAWALLSAIAVLCERATLAGCLQRPLHNKHLLLSTAWHAWQWEDISWCS